LSADSTRDPESRCPPVETAAPAAEVPAGTFRSSPVSDASDISLLDDGPETKMRNLLILATRPLEDGVTESLRRSDWRIHYAGSDSEARRVIAKENPPVGLLLLWSEDPAQKPTELTAAVSVLRQFKWVAALGREQRNDEAFIAMAAEHLFDFLSLPLDAERLATILGHAYGMADVDSRFVRLQERPREGRLGMIGVSPPMQSLYHEIERASACDVPVVTYGETGCGKEAAARAIHANSAFAEGTFAALSCPALPTNLLRGDPQAGPDGFFTFALDLDPARGTPAEVGTLFLDDVAELSFPAQASLLRLLDSLQTRRFCDGEAGTGNLRVISASEVNLETRVHEQRFRPDLFYRLQVLSIRVPSLRERGDDIQALAIQFLDALRRRHTTQARGFNLAATQAMAEHAWPGNLRELRNRIQQAALYGRRSFIAPEEEPV